LQLHEQLHRINDLLPHLLLGHSEQLGKCVVIQVIRYGSHGHKHYLKLHEIVLQQFKCLFVSLIPSLLRMRPFLSFLGPCLFLALVSCTPLFAAINR
jgi:hypothetical protein